MKLACIVFLTSNSFFGAVLTDHAGAEQIAATDTQHFDALPTVIGPDRFFGVLDEYLRATDNLWAEVHVQSYVSEIHDMMPKPGAVKQELSEYVFDFRRIGRSFRYRYKWWAKSDRQDELPDLDETIGYGAEDGVQRAFGSSKPMQQQDKAHAKISTWQPVSALSVNERFSRFFDGSQAEASSFYIPFLILHRDI